ncbi:hypothetical protein HK101_003274 [Irineochytrium annulatum]|nr:hypothetical protein HK101_003274 [Irineochytrium annulatum]
MKIKFTPSRREKRGLFPWNAALIHPRHLALLKLPPELELFLLHVTAPDVDARVALRVSDSVVADEQDDQWQKSIKSRSPMKPSAAAKTVDNGDVAEAWMQPLWHADVLKTSASVTVDAVLIEESSSPPKWDFLECLVVEEDDADALECLIPARMVWNGLRGTPLRDGTRLRIETMDFRRIVCEFRGKSGKTPQEEGHWGIVGPNTRIYVDCLRGKEKMPLPWTIFGDAGTRLVILCFGADNPKLILIEHFLKILALVWSFPYFGAEDVSVVFDKMELMFPKKTNYDDENGNYIDFFRCLERIEDARSVYPNRDIFVIGVTSNLNSVDVELISDFFEETFTLEMMTVPSRAMALQFLFQDTPVHPGVDLNGHAHLCHGFTLCDLDTFHRKAVSVAARRAFASDGDAAPLITTGDLEIAFKFARTNVSGLNREVVKAEPVRWSDIAGMEGEKRLLIESVVWFYEKADYFRNVGIPPSKGTLLYGPPGTGKTLLARAAAFESGANFMAVSVTDIIHGEIGESEKAIERLFESARKASPCIIFLDEIEALFGSRESLGEFSNKIFAQLLQEIDGLAPYCGVVVLAATNHPSLLDKTLIRPGRIDRLIAVSPPELSDRILVLEHCLAGAARDESVDLKEVAGQTAGWTGADLKELVRKSKLRAMTRESRESKVNSCHGS